MYNSPRSKILREREREKESVCERDREIEKVCEREKEREREREREGGGARWPRAVDCYQSIRNQSAPDLVHVRRRTLGY